MLLSHVTLPISYFFTYTLFYIYVVVYLVLCKYIHTFSLHIGDCTYFIPSMCKCALYGAALNLMTLCNDNKGVLFYSNSLLFKSWRVSFEMDSAWINSRLRAGCSSDFSFNDGDSRTRDSRLDSDLKLWCIWSRRPRDSFLL